MDILVIPDTQVKAGVDIRHIEACGNYIAVHKPDVIVVIGDWWDMQSLSRYGTKLELEGTRVVDDLQVGVDAMNALFKPIQTKWLKQYYKPRKIFCTGNHDPSVRIQRLYDDYPQLEGIIKEPKLSDWGFEVYDFLEVAVIEGIRFSHYFQNSHSAKKSPLGGMIDTMIKNAGFSFVQGHQQGLKIGKHYLGDGTVRIGIVAGSFYQHKERFMGTQGNEHWSGIIHLRNAKNGTADIAEIGIATMLEEYLQR